jgi:hypothetical protein
MIGPVLITSRKVRDEVREYLNLAEDVRDFVCSLWKMLRGQRFDEAQVALEDFIREQKAGPARHLASKLAGPRK